MTAPIIDRDAIIEKALIASGSEMTVGGIVRVVLQSFADDLLAPIEAIHQPSPTLEYLPNGVRIPWKACTCGFRTHSACPTAQAAAAIREAVRA